MILVTKYLIEKISITKSNAKIFMVVCEWWTVATSSSGYVLPTFIDIMWNSYLDKCGSTFGIMHPDTFLIHNFCWFRPMVLVSACENRKHMITSIHIAIKLPFAYNTVFTFPFQPWSFHSSFFYLFRAKRQTFHIIPVNSVDLDLPAGQE